jgi:hypothetical protein
VAPLGDAQWRAIAAKRIYFGHQSVGANILDGIRQLAAGHPGAALRIVSSRDPAAVSGPALIESPVGENGNPRSKDADFVAAMERGFGQAGGVAMYKYCYVDTDAATNPDQLFAAYQRTAASLRAKYPQLTLVHITLPLTSLTAAAEPPLKRFAKQALGRPTNQDWAAAQNAIRHQYNTSLRAAYLGKAPVFDLARLESTHADGTRCTVTAGGRTVECLAPEWTDDGGHLNAAAQYMVARELLALLAAV